jgi:hypothetical protein
MKKKVFWIIIIFLLSIILIFFYFKILKKKTKVVMEPDKSEEIIYNSNTFQDVNYATKDAKGNEYIINALLGEIDYDNPNVIYLTNVHALIKLNNSNNITITSDYGKYNTVNFDTIFSKNVIVNYLENQIDGQYLDFSLDRNSMIISKNVIYTNLENILTADVVEIDIDTKDTKIFMYNNDKKVNIQSKK